MTTSSRHDLILRWYDAEARDLPWRAPSAGAWQVLVSEVMLQQTPVERVLPAYEAWMERWPTPSALAAEPAGAAVRMWGRLGYPRRALRLHRAATVIDGQHAGAVPQEPEALRALPGVGEYTAAAVAAFAYRQRVVVMDTNIRRVLTRLVGGQALPPPSGPTRAERDTAGELLPADGTAAARWSVAVMELGALVCTARSPACHRCPVASRCQWRAAGYPAYDGLPRRVQTYANTDRQCRGRILALLREREDAVSEEEVRACWDEGPQRERALASLLHDGLVVEVGEGTFALP